MSLEKSTTYTYKYCNNRFEIKIKDLYTIGNVCSVFMFVNATNINLERTNLERITKKAIYIHFARLETL